MVFTHDSLPGKQFLFIPVAFVETGSCLLYPVSLHFLVFSRSFARQGSIFCVCRPQHAGHVSSLRWGSDSAVSPASLVWDRALLLPARLGHPFLSSWVNTGVPPSPPDWGTHLEGAAQPEKRARGKVSMDPEGSLGN